MSEQGKTVVMPMGMAVSIAENKDALMAFGAMSEEQRTKYILRGRRARTGDEMTMIVREIAALR